MKTEAAFEYAAKLGYDGVELMVWGESVSQDIDAVAKLSRRYRMPVLSVHAPCLLISQRVWGANPIPKLDRSVRAAEKLGAQTVVVHPPFRWQRRYVDGFTEQVASLEESSDVLVAVENMFPFRTDRFFGAGQTMERMRRRGELRADASPAVLATGLLACIEGGMVLSQARQDMTSLRVAVETGLAHVRTYAS